MINKIAQTEVDLLTQALERILSNAVVIKDFGDNLPKTDALQDSNKVYTGKASILFVDMRDSTKLPDQYDAERLIKIYRSYIRTVVQAVRYSNGVVRDFMGDGVLAVFIDDENGKAEDKAVYAARYITTAIDKFLNPLLDHNFKYRISCGIGIHTGEVTLSKVGMKGKEQDADAENEYGIAWIGNSTNLACKQSSAVNCGTIFISPSTYAALSNLDKVNFWRPFDIEKGTNHLSGYIAEHYYLDIDEEITPYTASDTSSLLPTTCLIEQKLTELSTQAIALGKKDELLSQKEKELHGQEILLQKKEEQLSIKTRSLDYSKYRFHKEALGSGFCKQEFILAMDVEFWEDHLQNVIDSGAKLGKSESKVKEEVSYYMVYIYKTLGLYDKAYDFLVAQARGNEWLHLYDVQEVVSKLGYHYALQSAVCTRIEKGDLSPDDQQDFRNIRDWLLHIDNIAPIG